MWATPARRKAKCELGGLTRAGGILQLKILKEDDRNGDPVDECAYTGGILRSFAEHVRWGDVKILADEPYILDLQVNHGGRVELVLDKFFSPRSYSPMFTRKFRVKGTEAGEKVLSLSTGVFRCPRVILVDSSTASGGEIIAEVVRRWCPETPVMGRLTFGKGAGTGWYRIGKFTVAVPEDLYFFGPDEQTIDGRGVIPTSSSTRKQRKSV